MRVVIRLHEVVVLISIPRRIFIPWLGTAPLSDVRVRSLEAFDRLGLPIIRITDDSIGDWIIPDDPFPEGWQFLTPIHQNDYLRCYLMHHHGGGYADIKAPGGGWVKSFDQIDDSGAWGAGYPEYWWGVANLGVSKFEVNSKLWWKYRYMQTRSQSLIGNCAFIFQPGTDLTREWLRETKIKLEMLTPALKIRPARGPREISGEVVNGVKCDYPVTWTAIGGDVFHPIALKYHKKIIRTLPRPVIDAYL